MILFILCTIKIYSRQVFRGRGGEARSASVEAQDSSKGGAVETGCSDLYDVMYLFIT